MYYVVSVAVGANIFLEDATVTVSAHFVENSTDFCDDSTDSVGSLQIPIVSPIRIFDIFNAGPNVGSVACYAVVPGDNDDNDDYDDSDFDPTYSPSEDESDSESNAGTDSDCEEDEEEEKDMLLELEQGAAENAENSLVDYEAAGVTTDNPMDGVKTNTETGSNKHENVTDSNATSGDKVVVAVTNNYSGRKYDKVAFCYFCSVPQAKLVRHLKLKHRNEQMVEELVNEKDEAKKKRLILKLRNLGNHKNNSKVTKAGEGVFVVAHRPKEAESYDKYIPCRYCFGYFATKSIWKHKCLLAPMTDSGAKVMRVRKGARNLSGRTQEGSVEVGFAGLLNGMRQDEIGTLAGKDHLILQLGRSLCERFGADRDQFNYVRGKMRQVARLLQELRRTCGKNMSSMSDFIHPTQFSEVAAAAKRVAGFQDDTGQYHAPSSALRSGAVIRSLAEIKQAEGLEHGDQTVVESCVQFLKLCQL